MNKVPGVVVMKIEGDAEKAKNNNIFASDEYDLHISYKNGNELKKKSRLFAKMAY